MFGVQTGLQCDYNQKQSLRDDPEIILYQCSLEESPGNHIVVRIAGQRCPIKDIVGEDCFSEILGNQVVAGGLRVWFTGGAPSTPTYTMLNTPPRGS